MEKSECGHVQPSCCAAPVGAAGGAPRPGYPVGAGRPLASRPGPGPVTSVTAPATVHRGTAHL
ncbi:hypothetical protein STXM2123_190 [Streptomyces sp. F-3]|nr:hypothetical protein STXM2123_190 [Streptomyces sp. F-3]